MSYSWPGGGKEGGERAAAKEAGLLALDPDHEAGWLCARPGEFVAAGGKEGEEQTLRGAVQRLLHLCERQSGSWRACLGKMS